MKTVHDVILAPVVSEKSYDLIEFQNKYTFEVDPRANKQQIRRAVEELFDVRVVQVNTMNRQGKRKDVKRAVVQLAVGDTIDLFGV